MKNETDFNNLILLLQNFADNQFAATALASYIAD